MTPLETGEFQRELANLVGSEPHILLIRRKTHTDILTNVNDPAQLPKLVAWLRSIANQIEGRKNERRIILPK